MNTSKYRIAAYSLAITFCLFNVGLPVIVYSCPMVKQVNGSTCMMCADQLHSNTITFSKTTDRSCCATVIAAARNTTEFLQVKSTVSDLSFSHLIVIQPVTLQIPKVSFNAITLFYSPPLCSEDIPLQISSLLI